MISTYSSADSHITYGSARSVSTQTPVIYTTSNDIGGSYLIGPAFKFTYTQDTFTSTATNTYVQNQLLMDGDVQPNANKTYNLGATGKRWSTIYYVTATTGTSRLAPSNTICTDCNKTMMRGTGTTITLGETEDYIPVFCPDCGSHKVEAISHLPRSYLKERCVAPKIEFLGIDVVQFSGNSRGIQVKFKYTDESRDDVLHKEAIINSTFLSDSEYEMFEAMSDDEARSFLLSLGQREWDALEEVRLMEEECAKLQDVITSKVSKWHNVDLLQ